MGLIEALNIRTIPVSAEQLSATTRGDRTLIGMTVTFVPRTLSIER